MPRSEIELRDARFNMERDWRNLEQGYRILTPMAGVLWDEAWRGSLRVLKERARDESVPRRVVPEIIEEVNPVEEAA